MCAAEAEATPAEPSAGDAEEAEGNRKRQKTEDSSSGVKPGGDADSSAAANMPAAQPGPTPKSEEGADDKKEPSEAPTQEAAFWSGLESKAADAGAEASTIPSPTFQHHKVPLQFAAVIPILTASEVHALRCMTFLGQSRTENEPSERH